MSEYHVSGEHLHNERDELLALISYMTAHNKQHIEELIGLAERLKGEEKKLLLQAADVYMAGTRLLERAFVLVKEK